MIKLYRYGYVGRMQIDEIEAEGETKRFWIIKGHRESKAVGDFPDTTWYRTPTEAVRAFIEWTSKRRDSHLVTAQRYQDKIDEASGFLLGLERETR